MDALRGEMTELKSTRQRLSRLYFRLVEESRARTQKFQSLFEDICGISAALDLDTMLASLAETLRKRMGFRIVVVRVREPGTDRLRARAFAGVEAAEQASLTARDVELESFLSRLGDEHRVGHSYFVTRNRSGPPAEAAPGAPAAPEGSEWGPDDVLVVPIYGRAGEVRAYLSVRDPEDGLAPSLETVGLLEILGNLAGSAIENAMLYRRLESENRDLESSARSSHEVHSLKSDFIAIVSRELRAPLAAIRAHVDTMLAAREEEIPFDLERRFLGVVHDESERLSRLIDSMLDLSRFDAFALKLDRRSVDVGEVLEEARALLAPVARAGQVDLKAQIDAADTRMDADRGQLKELVMHLGGNAVKFTPAGGRVTLGLRADARDVTLVVEDTGVGIPEPLLQRIFGRSQALDSSLVRRYGGAGLGLAISRSIVEWHGGHVFAESLPGEGSRFTVVLPRRTGPRVVLRPGTASRAGTEDVLRMAVEMVAQVMNARVVSLLAPQGGSGELVVRAALGLDEQVVREAVIQPGTGVAGWVAQHRRPVCVSDSTTPREGEAGSVYHTGTFLSVPLEGTEGLTGVLNVTDPISGAPFDAEDCHLLLHLAERVSTALREIEQADDPAAGLERTGAALRAAAVAPEHGRESASRRVRLARATGRALGLPEVEVGIVSFAASLADAGLADAGAPPASTAGDDAEAGAAGEDESDGPPLHPLEVLSAARDILVTRREWWDGSGYPAGLEGDRIPVGGRVLAVLDAFERMTAGEGERPALSPGDALRELSGLAGERFDPEVVKAFARAVAEWETPRSENAADSWEHASATQGGD